MFHVGSDSWERKNIAHRTNLLAVGNTTIKMAFNHFLWTYLLSLGLPTGKGDQVYSIVLYFEGKRTIQK